MSIKIRRATSCFRRDQRLRTNRRFIKFVDQFDAMRRTIRVSGKQIEVGRD